jgi:iron(III) transport system ATP-binding protein
MVRVESLKKSFATEQGGVNALDGVSFEVKPGAFFTLLGPSGCGKTTTLRSIAGLERPDEGEIIIGNTPVFSSRARLFVPGNKRNIGMVFQSYAIWPHMTVFENIAFPLRVRREADQVVRRKVVQAAELVGLGGMVERSATQLSGGQQQRVALARALVGEPKVLLLDEPLSNLDAKLRNQMRWELKELQSRLGTTTLYVTHDQVEALAISDEIALMNKGKLIQIGTPQEIYTNPASEFAADFIGAANLIRGELLGEPDADGRARVRTPLGELIGQHKCREGNGGKEVLVAFRPEVVVISSTPPAGACNVLTGKVQGYTYLGESTEFHLAVGDQKVQARVEPGKKWERGSTVYLQIPPEKCLVIGRGGI